MAKTIIIIYITLIATDCSLQWIFDPLAKFVDIQFQFGDSPWNLLILK